jgi:hypothetical protein
MSEKRMLILPADVVNRIDENRGDMSQAEFIEFLITNQLKEKEKDQKYATKEEVHAFEDDMRKLLKNFLDFFVSYGMDLGKESPVGDLGELTSKIQGLQKDMGSESGKGGGKATIKWK